MADQKVTGLTEDTTPALTDLVYGVKNPGTTPTSRKLTWSSVFSVLFPLSVSSIKRKSPPTSADSVIISDAADSGKAKLVLLSILHKALGMGLIPGQGEPLIIAAGSITPTHTFHRVDTEAAAATDDLDTIVTTNMVPGDRLTITSVSNARDVVVKDGTGNLAIATDFTLTNAHDTITLMRGNVSSLLLEISRSDNT